MKDKIISSIKYIVIGIIVILLARECTPLAKDILNYHKPIKRDTTIVTKRDTIWAKDTIYTIKYKRIEVPITTTLAPIDDTTQCNKVRIYKDTTEDNNIIIYSNDTTQGYLLGQQLRYKLKVPLTIIDSIKTTINVYIPTFPKVQLSGGVLVGKNVLTPILDLSLKRNTFEVGYNIQTSQPIIGYKFLIFKK